MVKKNRIDWKLLKFARNQTKKTSVSPKSDACFYQISEKSSQNPRNRRRFRPNSVKVAEKSACFRPDFSSFQESCKKKIWLYVACAQFFFRNCLTTTSIQRNRRSADRSCQFSTVTASPLRRSVDSMFFSTWIPMRISYGEPIQGFFVDRWIDGDRAVSLLFLNLVDYITRMDNLYKGGPGKLPEWLLGKLVNTGSTFKSCRSMGGPDFTPPLYKTVLITTV